MENTVKCNEWINKETFEVKSLPEDAVIKGIGWVKIPDDAEFAVSNGINLEFRKGGWYFGYDREWLKGSWCKEDFPKGDWKVVWERKTTEEVVKDEEPSPQEMSKVNQDVAHHIASILFRYVNKPQEVLLLDGMQEDNVLILKLNINAKIIVNHHILTDEEKSIVKVTGNDNFIVLNFSNNLYLEKFKNLFESFKSVVEV